MPARTTSVTLLGDTSDLQDALERAGVVAGDMSKKIRGSAADAAAAAADLARETGASADKQAEAAGRAAAAWSEMAASMTRAQKAAADAAAKASRAVGASVDEQRAAYGKAIAAQSDYEDAQKRAAAAASAAADEQIAAAKRAAAEQIAAAKATADAIEEQAARAKEARASFADLGGKVALGLAVGGGLSAYEGIKGAVNLQQQMERLHTQAGVSQQSIAPMQKSVLGMAGQVGESPEELAQGLYHVASSLNATLPPAQRASDEMKILRTASEGAKIGGADLVDTTNALDAALVSGIKGAQNYRQAMGAMNATVGAGDMTMQDLADAFGTGVVVQAKLAGVSIKQLGGALAVLGDNNIRGARAGTLLASTMRIMKAPSEDASEALNSVGLSSTSLAQALRSGGIVAALEDLKTHLQESGANANQTGLIITRAFGGRQSSGLQDLLGQLDRLKDKTKDVGDGMGNMGSAWSATQKTLAQQVDELKSHVEALGDEFGMFLIPKLEAVAQATSSVISWMKQHEAVAQALAEVIGGVLGAAMAAYAFSKAVAFKDATMGMMSAIGSFAQGAAKAAVSIATKLGLIGATSEEAATEFGASTAGMVADSEAMETGVVAAADGAEAGVDIAIGSTGIGLILVGAGLAATELVTHWQAAMNGLKVAAHAAADAVDFALNHGIIDPINAAISAINSLIRAYNAIPLAPNVGTVHNLGQMNLASHVFGSSGSTRAGASASAVNAATGATVGAPSGGSVTQQVAAFFSAHGFDRTAIAGLLGNAAQESSMNPSTPGGGLWQQISNFGSGSGGSLQNQMQTMLPQIMGLRSILNSSSSPAAAALAFENLFEKPKGTVAGAGATTPDTYWSANTPHRESAAQMYYQQLTGLPASSGSGGGSVNPRLASSLKKYLAQTPTSSYSSTASTAAATATIPVAVATMLKTAEALEGTHYTSGGGHGGWDPVAELKKIGLDCSGFVSQVLHRGGVSLPGPLSTQGLASNLQKGAGKYVTVFDRPDGSQAHTFMDIMGKYFMEGGNSAVNPHQVVTQLTAAQAKQELAGGGFKEFHPDIPGGKNVTTGSTSVLQSALAEIVAAHKKYLKDLGDSAKSLLSALTTEVQSGSVSALEKTLGVSTGGQTTTQINAIMAHLSGIATNAQINSRLSPVLQGMATPGDIAAGRRVVDAQRNAALARLAGEHLSKDQRAGDTIHIDKHYQDLMRQHGLNAHTTSSSGEQSFDKLIATLKSSHDAALSKLAAELVQTHKQAEAALAEELYAAQKTKDAESLTLEATELKDQAQKASDVAAAQLTVQKAIEQQAQDAQTAQTTDVQNMTQLISDQWAAAAQAIQDKTQIITDQYSGQATGISDAAQTQVDLLGERGLFGLNLIAQKLTVAYDQQKASDDKAIAVAQQNVDVVTAQWHAAEAAAQQVVDQITIQEQLRASAAQQVADQVAIRQDQRIAGATAHADAVQMTQDIAVQLAQTAVDLSANAPKAQQDKTSAQLALAQAQATKFENAAQGQLSTTTDAANKAIDAASAIATAAGNQAQQAIDTANSQLTTITGEANVAITTAQQTLATVEGQAQVAEATLQGAASVAGEEASVQFAGSGAQINIYGVPLENATAVSNEVSWGARTMLGISG